MKRVHAIIHGRVQGVFYRASTRDEAARLRLSGWVMNKSDGTVETEFQGEGRDVDAMLRWLRHGPPAARVDKVDWHEAPPMENEREFRVIY